MLALGFILAGLALVIVATKTALAAPGDTTRINLSSTGSQASGGPSSVGEMSANGRFILFASNANDLVPTDSNPGRDIFVRDASSLTTELISRNFPPDAEEVTAIAISPDGRFASYSYLVEAEPGYPGRQTVIAIFDRQTLTTDPTNLNPTYTGFVTPIHVTDVGDDAREVLYLDSSPGSDGLYLYNRTSGSRSLLRPSAAHNAGSRDARFSADGRFVAYNQSTSSAMQVLVLDRQSGQTAVMSVNNNGTEGDDWSGVPTISEDGRFVAFESIASNLVPTDTNGFAWDVFVHDRDTDADGIFDEPGAISTIRASVDSVGSQANQSSDSATISEDGRFVAFESSATNLVSNDTNGTWDVFVHDRQTRQTYRASVNSSGQQGNADSGWIDENGGDTISISANGGLVAFDSDSSNLVSGDTNSVPDIFIHESNFTQPTATPTRTSSPTSTPTCNPMWQVVPNPSGVSFQLNAVEVVSANDVWAVGPGTAILHWNGTAWSQVPPPTPGPDVVLNALSAVSANDVWAVGLTFDPNIGQEQTLAMHWNGTAWNSVPTPNVGLDRNALLGVAAISANDVWAVGYSGGVVGAGSPGADTLAIHWNGTAWAVVPSPNVRIQYNELHGVTAVTTNDVWAVGFTKSGGIQLTLTEHWDGTQWSVVGSPNGIDDVNVLNGVSAASANDIWAVGGAGNPYTVIEHWDGTAWTMVYEPFSDPPRGVLYGVSARAANDVWAVGAANEYFAGGATTIMHWDGAEWSQVLSPSPGTSGNHLKGVGVVSARDVWAVGSFDDTTGSQMLVERLTDPCPGSASPTATATATATTPTATATSTAALSMTPTNTPTVPTHTQTHTPTNTPTDTAVVPTHTPTNTPTDTAVIPTPTPADTPTSTSTNTLIPTSIPTDTPQPSATSVMSTDVPKSIPDAGTTSSELTITGGGGGQGFSVDAITSAQRVQSERVIAGVEVVGIEISTAAAADLDVYLVSPAGSMVDLFTDVCPGSSWSSANTGFNLSDSAPMLIGAQCPPGRNTYRPENPLSRFAGQSPVGTWRLIVTDDRAGGGVGTLNGWGLRLTTAPGPGPCNTCSLSVESVIISCNAGGTVHWVATVRNSSACTTSNIPWGADLEVRRNGSFNYIPVKGQAGTRSFPPGVTTISGDFCYHFPADANAMRARFGMVDRARQCIPNGVSASRPVCNVNPSCP
jgi:subtilisin-like proprotein convertase family protein